jgi:hypothetical protein
MAQAVAGVEISEATAFVNVVIGDNAPGVHVLDISNPTNPKRLSSDFPPGNIVVQNKIAYLTFNSSINTFDISNPIIPVELGYHSNISASDIFVKDEYIYIADSENGLYILRFNPSISGRVSHANGLPVENITISAGAGISIITSSDGGYVFTDLPDNTYTLTPTPPNEFTIQPTQHTVALPPIAPGRNFTLLAKPVTATLTPGQATTLTYTDTQGLLTNLNFPTDAVDQPTTVVVTPTIASRSLDFIFTGHAFDLAAYQNNQLIPSFKFKAPISVSIFYNDQDIRQVSNERQMALWQQSNGDWREAAESCQPAPASSYNIDQNEIETYICGTGLFGLFGPRFQKAHLPIIYRNEP